MKKFLLLLTLAGAILLLGACDTTNPEKSPSEQDVPSSPAIEENDSEDSAEPTEPVESTPEESGESTNESSESTSSTEERWPFPTEGYELPVDEI